MTAINRNDVIPNENILLCIICNQPFHRPKTLPCLHTFCEECLREFVFSRWYDAAGQFPCPVCRQLVCLPAGGVGALPDHFHVVGLLDSLSLNNSEVGSCVAASEINLRFCFGRHGLAVTDFMQPIGLAMTNFGDVIVSDRHRNRIMTFDMRGHVKGVFSCRHRINDIAMTDRNTIVVASLGEAMTVEYDMATGTKLRKFGTFSCLDPAHGVAIIRSPPFHIAVSSCETGTLYILADSGRLVRKFARRSVIGKPYHLAASSRGELIVSDFVNNRICIIDRVTGNCKVQMGCIGTGPGSLYQPLGVAVDEEDNIIVADSGNRRIALFTIDGKFRGIIVDMSRSVGKPVNVAYSPESSLLAILVTGPSYAQIRIFSYASSKLCDASTASRLFCCSSGQAV
jgi:hypothetical protein